MTDMRQKLLPVFLEESGRKILQLEEFLAAPGGEGKSLEDLETVFRAAHTLKGTSMLVQADAVSTLSGRIEGLLESHFEASRFPSLVEYEAMQLAVDRLKQLIEAVKEDRHETAGLLAEADLALKLAAGMPGNRRLAELFNQDESNNPFAEDVVFDAPSLSETASGVIADPFADDPTFDAQPVVFPVTDNDPFADDPGLEPPAGIRIPAVKGNINVIDDPFVDDPALDIDPIAQRENPLIQKESSLKNSAPETEPRETYAARMRKRLEKESSIGTAERLAKTLLAQNETAAVERGIRCCCFRIADKDYFLPIANMIEVADLPPIIRLPLAPAVVRGLINLRGKVLPVIDLSVQGRATAAFVAVRKLVIAESDGEQLAFLADGIPDLAEEPRGEKVDVARFVTQFRAGAT